MTVPSRTIARSALWVSLIFHLLVVGADLAVGSYHQAALVALCVVGLTSWLHLFPKMEAKLDAKAAEAHALQRHAEAQQRISDLAFTTMQAQSARGSLRVDVLLERGKARMK